MKQLKQAHLVFTLCVLITGCAGRSQLQKGYEQGAADTAKRQYWIEQSLQKGKETKQLDRHVSVYRITVPVDPDAKVKTVPYEISIPVVN